jgi:isocitrate dehydrogenase
MMLRYIGWREAADLLFHGVRKAIEAKELTFDLARLREAIRQPRAADSESAQSGVRDQMERLVPGAKLVGTTGFGEAVIRHMED